MEVGQTLVQCGREWFWRERLDAGSARAAAEGAQCAGMRAGAEEAQRTGERAEEARGESRAQRGLVTEMVTGPVRTVDWPETAIAPWEGECE